MTTIAPSSRRRSRSLFASLATVAALGLGAVGIAPAVAATPTPGDSGWVRVAHLSPDTKTVDVQLTALAGGAAVVELNDVAYGMVSDYQEVPSGTYVVSMVPSGSASTAEPMISASVDIEQGKSITVAAFGVNDKLQTKVFADDLTSPEAGAARIRLIQASTVTKEVDVATTTGLLIARDAQAGSATSYATVPAGAWNLELTASGIDDSAAVDLPNGSVNTLFVLDNSDGGLTVTSVLDSASVGQAPIGGVQTGGGALADTLIDTSVFASNAPQ